MLKQLGDVQDLRRQSLRATVLARRPQAAMDGWWGGGFLGVLGWGWGQLVGWGWLVGLGLGLAGWLGLVGYFISDGALVYLPSQMWGNLSTDNRLNELSGVGLR